MEMNKEVQVICSDLDEEWVELILKARNMGLTVEDIRRLLSKLSRRQIQ